MPSGACSTHTIKKKVLKDSKVIDPPNHVTHFLYTGIQLTRIIGYAIPIVIGTCVMNA